MSKKFLETYGTEPVSKSVIRKWTQRPGKQDKDGNPVYFTQQSSKEVCDINQLIIRYRAGQLITHVSAIEGRYGDVPEADYKEAMDLIAGATSMFNQLPSSIRNRFENNPGKLLGFMENPDNRAEAIKLGLISPDWTEETDGLGEHVILGENQNKTTPIEEPAQ